MPNNTVIIDYGMGNLNSVAKKIRALNAQVIISSKAEDILKADKIILPGVGHFKKAMENIHTLNLYDSLNEAVQVKHKPILGICLGLQLMAKSSEEGNVKGLGWIDADVLRFKVNDTLKYKVPHTGWNQIINKRPNSLLMQNIPNLSEFYFVHSYYLKANDKSIILNETEYETIFTSAIEQENIFGVQYHPEKSHDSGALMLKNFINL